MAIPFLLFLICLSGIGIFHSQRLKKPVEFYLAGRKGDTWTVSNSLLATILGSSAILGTVELSGSQGWASSWLILSGAIGLLGLIPLASKVRSYGSFTFPGLMEQLYGPQAKWISSLIIPFAWVGIIAAQLIGAAMIIGHFVQISYPMSVCLSAAIIMLYTLAGGQLSILLTDKLQFLLILGGLGMVAALSFQTPITSTDSVLAFPFNTEFSPLDLGILLLTYGSTFLVGPDMYSRLFCAKNEAVASKAVSLTVALLIPMALLLSYLGVYAHQHIELVEGVHPLIQLIDALLPPWGMAILSLALLSAVLSSADTTLLTASSILSDLFPGGLKSSKSIQRTRYLIILLSIISLVVALWIKSLIASLLIALSIFSGACIIPTLFGLLGYKAKDQQVFWAMLVGGSIALVGKLLGMYGWDSTGNLLLLCAFFLNGMILFAGPKNAPKEKI